MITFAYLSISKAYVEQDLASAEKRLEELTDANKQFVVEINAQNEKIAEEERADKEREDAAQKAIDAAEMTAKQYLNYAQQLASDKPDNIDDCKASIDFLNAYVRHK